MYFLGKDKYRDAYNAEMQSCFNLLCLHESLRCVSCIIYIIYIIIIYTHITCVYIQYILVICGLLNEIGQST